MIEYLIGVDGGGTGTRVRLAGRDGSRTGAGKRRPLRPLATASPNAWTTILSAIGEACAVADIGSPPLSSMAIGLGLAGVHNKDWAAQFVAADPGFAALVLDTDGFSTLMGAHGGQPGAIVAIGTGSVGEAMRADGTQGRSRRLGLPGRRRSQRRLDGPARAEPHRTGARRPRAWAAPLRVT